MNNIESILGKTEAMPTELQTTAYKSMMRVYDDIEGLLKIATNMGSDADPYLKHLKKLVNTVEENMAVIMDKFFDYAETGHHVSNIEKLKIEKAIKEVSISLQQFLNKVS